MNVLLLTQLVPYPPDSGPRIKTYHVLRWLAQEHNVTLVSFIRSAQEAAAAEELRRICHAVYTVPLRRARALDLKALVRTLADPRPFLMLRDENDAMDQLLRRLVTEQAFDLIHADQLNMAAFALGLAGPPVVLDLHNAVWTIVDRLAHEASGPKRWLLLLERARLQRYEGQVCREAHGVVAVSEPDRAALRSVAGDVAVDIVPIAIDVGAQPLVRRDRDAKAAVSVATMFWPPNVDGVCWFGHNVYPRIRARRPDTRFYVVGARPTPTVRHLAAQQSGVVVTGYVADLTPFHRQTAAFVVPLHAGSGMRVKILDAFARGLPVVSTTVGYEGIAARPGEHFLLADEPELFAEAVLALVGDRRLGERLIEAARHLVESHYDWRRVCPRLATTYARALTRAR